MNNISSSTSTSLSNEFPHLYSGLSGSSSSLSTSSSTNSEQKTQPERDYTIKNIHDVEEAFARIPREVLQGGKTPRHISFCSKERIIFSDGKELSGKFITNGNTIVDRNRSLFFNFSLHKEFQPLAESQIGLRSEFEAVTIKPSKKSDSIYSNVKITIWDLSSPKAKEKESWIIDIEDLLNSEKPLNPKEGDIHYNLSEDGKWFLITISQKNCRKVNYIYKIADQKRIYFQEALEITAEYFLPEGYLVTATDPTGLAVCRFISIDETKWNPWMYPAANVLDYNKDWVLITIQDTSNQESLYTINLKTGKAIDFEGAKPAKLCDNFIITFGGRCTIQDIHPNEKLNFDKKNCTDRDLQAAKMYIPIYHFSESVMFLDILIKANKINIFFKEREEKHLAQFGFTEPKKRKFTDSLKHIFFGNNEELSADISEIIFNYMNQSDLTVAIQVSRGWRDLSKRIVLGRLQTFISLPGRCALIFNETLGHSYDSSSFVPSIRSRDRIFLPTADLPEQKQIRQKIATEWKILAQGKKYVFAETSKSHVIAIFDMDSKEQEIRYLDLGTGNDIAGVLLKGIDSFVTVTKSGKLTQWSINWTNANQANNQIFNRIDQSQFKLNENEYIVNFFTPEQNKYVVVTSDEDFEIYFVSVFNWENKQVSSVKRHEFPLSSLTKPLDFIEDEEIEIGNYTFFYKNGLLFFTWDHIEDGTSATLYLAAFSIEPDKLELVWATQSYQNSTFEDTPPKIILHNEDYIVITGGNFDTTPPFQGFKLRPLTVLETKSGKTVLTLWIDQKNSSNLKFTAFISNDLLGIQGTGALDGENIINLYHLTTGQFLGLVPTRDKEIRDMKFLDDPNGPRIRFLCCEKVEEDNEPREVVKRIDIWVADIILKSPEDFIATIPQTPGNFHRKTPIELFTYIEMDDMKERLRANEEIPERPIHGNDMEIEEEKKEQCEHHLED